VCAPTHRSRSVRSRSSHPGRWQKAWQFRRRFVEIGEILAYQQIQFWNIFRFDWITFAFLLRNRSALSKVVNLWQDTPQEGTPGHRTVSIGKMARMAQRGCSQRPHNRGNVVINQCTRV